MKDTINMNGVMCNFSYAGMPFDEAERSMRCFVKYVLPELKKWKIDPLLEPQHRLKMPAPAAKAA